MISSQIIKASIEELSAISKVSLAVWDPEGKEIAATFETDDISPSLVSGFVVDEPDLKLYSFKNPRAELHFVAREINRLTQEGFHYREIAVVCGDLAGYANYAKEVFAKYRIPLFLDQKSTALFHPFAGRRFET